MKIGTILLGIVLFFLATCIIYVWGMKKQRDKSGDLMNLLFSNGLQKVKKYMKTHDSVTEEEVEALCEGLTAKLPFSTGKAVVTDTKEFSERLLSYMVKTGLLEKKDSRYVKGK